MLNSRQRHLVGNTPPVLDSDEVAKVRSLSSTSTVNNWLKAVGIGDAKCRLRPRSTLSLLSRLILNGLDWASGCLLRTIPRLVTSILAREAEPIVLLALRLFALAGAVPLRLQLMQEHLLRQPLHFHLHHRCFHQVLFQV